MYDHLLVLVRHIEVWHLGKGHVHIWLHLCADNQRELLWVPTVGLGCLLVGHDPWRPAVHNYVKSGRGGDRTVPVLSFQRDDKVASCNSPDCRIARDRTGQLGLKREVPSFPRADRVVDSMERSPVDGNLMGPAAA